MLDEMKQEIKNIKEDMAGVRLEGVTLPGPARRVTAAPALH